MMPKGKSEEVIRRTTDNTLVKRKGRKTNNERQNTTQKTKQHEPHK